MAERRLKIEELIQQIQDEVQLTSRVTGISHLGDAVIDAIRSVDRQHFVSPEQAALAYIDEALPIKHGQTITQPFVVALMTHLLELKPDDVVLEIGTGSGYQAAILSRIAKRVFSIEVVNELASEAQKHFAQFGFKNVSVHVGNGREGLIEHAPYDGIIVTAASQSVPPKLLEQLKPQRHLVIPIGPFGETQTLTVFTKLKNSRLAAREVLPVRFVPLVNHPPI